MNTETKHTPTPWVGRKAKTHFMIEAANGVLVAKVHYIGRPDGSTSATEVDCIVRAVNAHEALVEAARAALQQLAMMGADAEYLEEALELAEGVTR